MQNPSYISMLTVNSGRYGKQTEIIVLAGSLGLHLAPQGQNPAKSILRGIVEKRDSKGHPAQPCGEITMNDHQCACLRTLVCCHHMTSSPHTSSP